VAVVVRGVAVAAAIGWLTREAAPYWMLGVLVAGGLVLGVWFGPALLRPQPSKDGSAELDATPDRDSM
jgi:hypothetical protein